MGPRRGVIHSSAWSFLHSARFARRADTRGIHDDVAEELDFVAEELPRSLAAHFRGRDPYRVDEPKHKVLLPRGRLLERNTFGLDSLAKRQAEEIRVLRGGFDCLHRVRGPTFP